MALVQVPVYKKKKKKNLDWSIRIETRRAKMYILVP